MEGSLPEGRRRHIYKSEEREKDSEREGQRAGWQQRSIRQEIPRWNSEKDIPEAFFPTPNFQVTQTHKQFFPFLPLPC